MSTKIEWADETWNPVTGCSPISEGCANCYAARMSKRHAGRFGYPKDEPFRVTTHPDKLERPFHWKKPKRIFVCSMGDLFHDKVPFDYINQVIKTIVACKQHTFLILTKRPKRMFEYFRHLDLMLQIVGKIRLPIPNLHLGVTAGNQARADERIPILLQTPAAKRFMSCEPLLGPISLNLATTCDRYCNEYQEAFCPGTTGKCIGQVDLDQVIVGAETGPGKRQMAIGWAQSLRDQCQTSETPFFFKKDSNGNHELGGKIWEELPGEHDIIQPNIDKY